jgi:hypothetical protein
MKQLDNRFVGKIIKMLLCFIQFTMIDISPRVIFFSHLKFNFIAFYCIQVLLDICSSFLMQGFQFFSM